MRAETRFTPITRCPAIGDTVFINDHGRMRQATISFSISDEYIEFVFNDDGGCWSLVLPDGRNPLVYISA